jgi:hypothetical protein
MERLSTVDLLVQAIKISSFKSNILYFYSKLATLMKRSIVLSLHQQLVLYDIAYKHHFLVIEWLNPWACTLKLFTAVIVAVS